MDCPTDGVHLSQGLFFANEAISYGQAPIDGVMATTSPGAEIKQLFLPTPQVSFTAGLTDNLSLSGEYGLGWEATRVPAGGTYFGVTDFLFKGADRFYAAAAGSQPLFFIRKGANEPGGAGKNWGFALHYNFDNGGTGGLYYRHFDDPNPYSAPLVTPAVAPTPDPHGGLNGGTYTVVYNRGTQLLGLSYVQTVSGVSIAGEASYRRNTALNNTGYLADGQGPTGDMLNILVNAISALPRTFLSKTGTIAFEMAFSHLTRIDRGEAVYNQVHNPAVCPTQAKNAGCSTTNFLAAAVNFTPQYLEAFPGVDLSVPITLNYGILGNFAGVGGGNEGALTYSAGIEALIQQEYDIKLAYLGSFARTQPNNAAGFHPGGNGTWFYNDRGRVNLTFSVHF